MDSSNRIGADCAQQSRQDVGYGYVGGAGPSMATSPPGAVEGNPKRLIGFSFSEALDRVKQGRRMARIGWNGHGQFIYIVTGSDPSHPDERAGLLSGIRASLFAFGDRGTVRRLPHVALHNTRGESVPWTPSQTDMLAEDWISA